jgi:hypothetical protein
VREQQFKLGLVELFLEPSTKKQVRSDHFGMWFEIVDYRTDLRLFREF